MVLKRIEDALTKKKKKTPGELSHEQKIEDPGYVKNEVTRMRQCRGT